VYLSPWLLQTIPARSRTLNEQPNGDPDAPPNVRFRGEADIARTCRFVRL